jgi:hypothetical protein
MRLIFWQCRPATQGAMQPDRHMRAIAFAPMSGTSNLLPRLASTAAALLLLVAQASVADPLHRLAGTPDWRHEFSGWVFSQRIATFERLGEPWQIDGGDNVGARYATPGAAGSLVIEVLSATALPIPNATAVSFPELPELHGFRAISTGDRPSSVQYVFESRDWSVRIVTTIEADASLELLERTVRALPWKTLGSSDRLH